MITTINIPKDFSPAPAGRYLTDGPHTGTHFRERNLRPALASADHVVVQMDGADYGSSFLEEAFGGIVRHHYFTVAELRSKLEVVSGDSTLVEEVWEYIEAEQPSEH